MNLFKLCSFILFYFISRIAVSENTRETFTDPEHQVISLNPTLIHSESNENHSQKIFLASDQ